LPGGGLLSACGLNEAALGPMCWSKPFSD
jgi:hypothetical protein